MDHAILVAAGTGIEGENLSACGEVKFGSLPQIKRLVITAQRAGIKSFTIITDRIDSPLKGLLAGDKRIESDINWHTLGADISLGDSPSLIIQSNLVTTPKALSNFMEQEPAPGEIAVLVDTSGDGWIKASDGEVTDLYSQGGRAVGAFMASARMLEKSITDSMSISAFVKEQIGRDKVRLREFSDSYWMRLSSDKDSAKRAEELIFRYVGKTATGWLAREVNSKISLPTSKLLVKTPLTPNMISVLINVIGAFCGVFYAIGHPVIGALCMQAATILDRCDGEIARVKLMETKKGQWVDTISDQVTVLSFLIGVPVGYYSQTHNPIALVLGGINLSIFIFFVIWSFYFLKKYTNSGSLVAYFEVDKLVENSKTSTIRKVIKFFRPVSRRNVYSLAFLILAIVSGYPLILGFTTIGLILFLVHQLEDIIKLRKINPESSILK
jgi:CDP-L-myo-inositol myo-inositolphosphotransferase